MALKAAGIELSGGVSGEADKAVQAYIDGNLAYNPNVKCSHHEHDHGEEHVCGDHGCGLPSPGILPQATHRAQHILSENSS